MTRRVAATVVFALPVLLSACGLVSTGWILSPEGCTNKETVDAILHVEGGEDRLIWAVDRTTGADISLRIPGGYGAGYGPGIDAPSAIFAPSGEEIGHTGDLVVSGCRDIVQDALLIDETDIQRVGAPPS